MKDVERGGGDEGAVEGGVGDGPAECGGEDGAAFLIGVEGFDPGLAFRGAELEAAEHGFHGDDADAGGAGAGDEGGAFVGLSLFADEGPALVPDGEVGGDHEDGEEFGFEDAGKDEFEAVGGGAGGTDEAIAAGAEDGGEEFVGELSGGLAGGEEPEVERGDAEFTEGFLEVGAEGGGLGGARAGGEDNAVAV